MASCPRDLKFSPPFFTGSLFPRLTSWHGLPFLLNSFGGLAVLLGAFVALVSLPMAALLLVAMFTVRPPLWVQPDQADERNLRPCPVRAAPGYEVNLLYLACLAALVLGGSGPMAIDRYLRMK
jgi:putative oxidoreductase